MRSKSGGRDPIQFRDIQAHPPRLKSLDLVSIPAALPVGTFELKQGVAFPLGKRRTFTLVPPQAVLESGKVNLKEVFQRPRSWLAVLQDDFGQLNAQELELEPASKKGTLRIRLLRSTGRVIAEGTVTLEGDAVSFEVKTVAKRSVRALQPVFRGRLTGGSRWQFARSFGPFTG